MLIFVHELGHFMVAKACGVKVTEFAMGMGPAAEKAGEGETLYSLRGLPMGGFCAMGRGGRGLQRIPGPSPIRALGSGSSSSAPGPL